MFTMRLLKVLSTKLHHTLQRVKNVSSALQSSFVFGKGNHA